MELLLRDDRNLGRGRGRPHEGKPEAALLSSRSSRGGVASAADGGCTDDATDWVDRLGDGRHLGRGGASDEPSQSVGRGLAQSGLAAVAKATAASAAPRRGAPAGGAQAPERAKDGPNPELIQKITEFLSLKPELFEQRRRMLRSCVQKGQDIGGIVLEARAVEEAIRKVEEQVASQQKHPASRASDAAGTHSNGSWDKWQSCNREDKGREGNWKEDGKGAKGSGGGWESEDKWWESHDSKSWSGDDQRWQKDGGWREAEEGAWGDTARAEAEPSAVAESPLEKGSAAAKDCYEPLVPDSPLDGPSDTEPEPLVQEAAALTAALPEVAAPAMPTAEPAKEKATREVALPAAAPDAPVAAGTTPAGDDEKKIEGLLRYLLAAKNLDKAMAVIRHAKSGIPPRLAEAALARYATSAEAAAFDGRFQ